MNFVSTFCVLFCLLQLGLCYEDKNVYQCLILKNYTSFAQLIREARLDVSLSGSGPYTILAPTNAAVASIDANTMATLAHNNQLTKQIVQYHIINSYNIVPSMLSAGSLLTSLGQPVNAAKSPSGVILNNSTVMDTANSDVVCNNGIIHRIESVMFPPIFSTDNLAAVLIERDDIFKEFFLYILLSHLTQLIETGEYTLFAPTDLAFGRYSHVNDITPQTPNRTSIYFEILKYHLVPGARYSYQLHDKQQLFTLHGYPINISLNRTDVMVDSAKVVEANIPASNGVIHAIDHVLYPTDLLQNLLQGGSTTL